MVVSLELSCYVDAFSCTVNAFDVVVAAAVAAAAVIISTLGLLVGAAAAFAPHRFLQHHLNSAMVRDLLE